MNEAGDGDEAVSDENIEAWFHDVTLSNHPEMVMVATQVQLNRLRLGLLEGDVCFKHFNYLGEMLEVNEYANFSPKYQACELYNVPNTLVEKILMTQVKRRKGENRINDKPN